METKIFTLSPKRCNHGCTDYATFECKTGEDYAVCVEAQSCQSCWQVGHDSSHKYFEVGDTIQVSELLSHADLDKEDEDRKMKTWERDTYYIDEEAFDYDLHKFSVYTDDGEFIAEIYPNSIPEMEVIIEDLDNGEDVDGWEDGQGNTIIIPRQ